MPMTLDLHTSEGVVCISLNMGGRVPGIDQTAFEQAAATVTQDWPISEAVAAVEIMAPASLG